MQGTTCCVLVRVDMPGLSRRLVLIRYDIICSMRTSEVERHLRSLMQGRERMLIGLKEIHAV
jgi:hypothetical protein